MLTGSSNSPVLSVWELIAFFFSSMQRTRSLIRGVHFSTTSTLSAMNSAHRRETRELITKKLTEFFLLQWNLRKPKELSHNSSRNCKVGHLVMGVLSPMHCSIMLWVSNKTMWCLRNFASLQLGIPVKRANSVRDKLSANFATSITMESRSYLIKLFTHLLYAL